MLSRFRSKKKPQLVDRDGDRYEVSLRVLSRDLPGYRGVTLDLSRSGVQLETSGLLEVGSEPELTFEFDRGELETFACRAKVVWSRQQGDNKRKIHSGLTFVPQTDDEIRQISRMATVLQTRSETDLKTLLDQARRIDPELERSYHNISTNQPFRPAPAGSPVEIASTPPPPPPVPNAPPPPPPPSRPSVAQRPPHLGVFIPLRVALEGYTWNRSTRTLHVGLREGQQVHNLFFPDCQLFQVLEPAADRVIGGLYSTLTSPATRKLQLAGAPSSYKHYRFVADDGKGLIDIISCPCKPTGP
jgi:PilZ domain